MYDFDTVSNLTRPVATLDQAQTRGRGTMDYSSRLKTALDRKQLLRQMMGYGQQLRGQTNPADQEEPRFGNFGWLG